MLLQLILLLALAVAVVLPVAEAAGIIGTISPRYGATPKADFSISPETPLQTGMQNQGIN